MAGASAAFGGGDVVAERFGEAATPTAGVVPTTRRSAYTRRRMTRRTLPVLVAAFTLSAGCTGTVSHAYTTQTTQPGPTSTQGAVPPSAASVPAGPLAITGAGFDVHTAGKVSQATFDATWAGVLSTLNRYLEAAVLTPLRSGGPAGDLGPLFTSLADDRATGADRAAFVDEGLPAASDVQSEAAVATLTALGGADGTVSVVSASLNLRLKAQAAGAPLTVSRTGELVLLPDGGTWRIDAYDIRVSRTVADTATTTTAHS